MGKSGFTIIESGSGTLASGVNMVTDFQLPASYPDNLMTFLQISLSLSESSTVLIIRNGVSYPINNNNPLIGEVYRSIAIKKDEIINLQFGTTQTTLKFKFSLEE